MDTALSFILDQVYRTYESSKSLNAYLQRHNINSLQVLTVYDDETASTIAAYLAPRITGRTVIEIGGGIGLLAFHLGLYAKRVYCIEADPNWSWTFVACLLDRKPKNVSYLFGAADEFIGQIHGDIAVFCTHSDAAGMREIGYKFSQNVIDIYSEVVEPHWNQLRNIGRNINEEP